MYGKVTSRNHLAYNWGNLLCNNMVTCIDSATECGFANSVVIYYELWLAVLFLKVGKLDKEVKGIPDL